MIVMIGENSPAAGGLVRLAANACCLHRIAWAENTDLSPWRPRRGKHVPYLLFSDAAGTVV